MAICLSFCCSGAYLPPACSEVAQVKMIKNLNKFFIYLLRFCAYVAATTLRKFKDRAAFVIFKIYSRALLCALPARQICRACLCGQI